MSDLRDPSACRWCGVGKRAHLNHWDPEIGWHTWIEPTWDQRRDAIIYNSRVHRDMRNKRDREEEIR